MIHLVKLALVDGFMHHLHMTEKLLWSSLVEDGDSEMHAVRDLDLQSVVLTVNKVLFRDICYGWFDTSAPLTVLRLQSFWDRLSGRHLFQCGTK